MATEKTKILIEVQANEQEVKKLQQQVNELKEAIVKLREAKKAYAKELKIAKKEEAELGKQVANNKITTEQYVAAMKKNAATQKTLNKGIKDTDKLIEGLNAEYKEANRDLKINQRITDSATGSYNQLTGQLAKSKIAWKQLSKEERENTKAGKELTEQQNEITTKLKELDDSTNLQARNVGNYTRSIVEAMQSLDGVPDAAKGAAGGVQNLGAAFKALLANPVILMLSVLVVALKGLFDAFKKSKTGSELLNKGMGALQGICL